MKHTVALGDHQHRLVAEDLVDEVGLVVIEQARGMPNVLRSWPYLKGKLVKELLQCEQTANWSQSPT